MSKLTNKEFMDKIKVYIGDKDDDETLQFLQDIKDTITDDKDDWKTKYEDAVKEKDSLDKQWRTKFKEAFYSSDTNINNNKDNQDNTPKDNDSKTDAEIKAETITYDDLFKPVD